MKSIIKVFAITFFFFSTLNYSVAQQLSSCTNADFELNSFANWNGSTGFCCPISMSSPGIVSGQHTIMTGPGTDPYSLGQIPVVAPGGQYSARLGNDNVGSEAEQLVYSFTVTSQTELFIYRYAVVLEDPSHDPIDQPRFEIRVYDQNNAPVNCGTYNVVSSANIPGFQNNGSYRFKTWTTVGIELSAYMGQTVTIEFSTGDCALGGHFGYAYVDCYCSPLTISADYCPNSNTSTLTAPVGFESYLWNTGATTQSITVVNPIVGTTYSCTMTSVTGCTVTLNNVLTPTTIVADFNLTASCASYTHFLDSSYVIAGTSITAWAWNFGDGQTSILQSPTHIYSNPGNYNVQLIITNFGGCKDTTIIPVTIRPNPTADFSAPLDCPDIPVLFSDNSSSPNGPITDWAWNFGDLTPGSTVQDPLHTFSAPGTYSVQLIVEDSIGCIDTTVISISTSPAPVADFNSVVFCQNATVQFTNASVINGGTLAGLTWDFGDGSSQSSQTNPTHIYPGSGVYDVTLIAESNNGCTDTIVKQVTIGIKPTVDFSYINSCSNASTSFTDLSSLTGGTINAWSWNFDDGSPVSTIKSPGHIFSSPGNYNVTLIATGSNGCVDSIQKTVTVSESPVAAFNTSPVCPGTPAQFNDQSVISSGSISSWSWNFGDATPLVTAQNPVHTYTSAGSFNVTLVVTAANGCKDTIISPVATSVAPTSVFAVPTGCEGASVHFTDNSTITGGSISSWTWNWGDGTPNTISQNANHIFTNGGNYFVTLITESNTGCIDSVMHEVPINHKPDAVFNTDSVCFGDSTHFMDLSSVTNSFIASWSWKFGDGGTSIIQSPYHTYAAPGNYSASLIVQTPLGCSDTIFKTVNVKGLPNAQFISSNACIGQQVSFTDQSVTAIGSIVDWDWDFGDGSSHSALQNPVHTFTSAGFINIILTATGSNGCSGSRTQSLNVRALPTVDFIFNNVCDKVPVSFSDQTINNPGVWQWNFGDGNSDTLQNPSHTYGAAGLYNVHLTATDAFGCINDTIHQLQVYALPVANFGVNNPCSYDTVYFNNTSSNGSGTISQWAWAFGDGGTSALVNPSHHYLSSGIYNASLVATSSFGCKDTIIKPVNVKVLPVSDFTVGNRCVFAPVSFNDNSSIAAGSLVSWFWNFDDNNSTSSLQNPLHTYSLPGSYNVLLVVEGNNGCVDSIITTVIVNPLPVSDFSQLNVCKDFTMSFTDLSSTISGSFNSWSWNFGDSTSLSALQNTQHLYSSDGIYTVSLTVTDANGCINDTSKSVQVYPLPIADFSFNTPCVINNVNFRDLTTITLDSIVGWDWNFGDGGFSNQQDPTHIYGLVGSYTSRLISTSNFGCKDSVTKQVDVHPLPVPDFMFDRVCFKENTPYYNLSTIPAGSITGLIWGFGDSTSFSNNGDTWHLYSAPSNNYPVQLTAISDFGCKDSIVKSVEVYELPVPNFIPDITAGCKPLVITFNDSSYSNDGTITDWLYDFGDGQNSAEVSPSHLYTHDGIYTVSLSLISSLGCKDTLIRQNLIEVYPKPEAGFAFYPDKPSILSPQVDFTDQSSGTTIWNYSFGDSTSSDLANPVHFYQKPGSYYVTQIVLNQYGCSDTITEFIGVDSAYTFYVPNAFTPNGDGQNDFFTGYGIGIKNFSMLIFDRWGEKLYESTSSTDPWNGKYKGQDIQVGVYVYVIRLKDIFDETHTFEGRVTLLR